MLMKNKFLTIGIALCLIIIFFMLSCSGDNTDRSKLVGIWGCIHSQETWRENRHDAEYDEYVGGLLVIKEDGTYTWSSRHYGNGMPDAQGTWMVYGDTVYFNDEKFIVEKISKQTLKLHNEWELYGRNTDSEFIKQ